MVDCLWLCFGKLIMSKLKEGCDRISFEISKILQDRDNMIAGYSPVILLKKFNSESVA